MAAILQKTNLRLKGAEGNLYTTNDLRSSATDDNLVAFAEAVNSLQEVEADKFIKKLTYLMAE